MRLFFSKHELKLRRKRNIAAVVCVVIGSILDTDSTSEGCAGNADSDC